jgi:hypothetical protein
MPRLAALVLLALLVAACSDAPRPTAPPAAGESSLASVAGGSDRIVSMLDACDPATFNAAIGDGTCTRTGGGVTFEQFSNGSIAAWRFAPGTGEDGTELYQCSIHPWMRVTVHANHGS